MSETYYNYHIGGDEDELLKMDSGVSRLGVDYILISQSLPRLLFHQLAEMEDKKHAATFNMSLSQTGAVNTDM